MSAVNCSTNGEYQTSELHGGSLSAAAVVFLLNGAPNPVLVTRLLPTWGIYVSSLLIVLLVLFP